MAAAYRALRPGGRLVAITSANRDPSANGWRHAFPRRQPAPDVLFTSPIAGRLYRSRGTTYETCLTVLEKPGEKTRGTVAIAEPAASAEDLLTAALDALPPRLPLQNVAPAPKRSAGAAARGRTKPRKAASRGEPAQRTRWRDAQPLAYTSRRTSDAAVIDDDRPYHPWTPSVVIIDSAKRHPHDTGAVGGDERRGPPAAHHAAGPAGPSRHRRDAVRRPAREHRARGRGALRRPARAVLDRQRLRHRALPRPQRPAGHGRLAPGPGRREQHHVEQAHHDAPRLDARRRNRDGEGPAGRRDHSRPLAAGEPEGALAVGVRQADRGRPARLDGLGGARERHRSGQQVAPERPHRPGHGNPVLDLRDPAVRRPRRQPVEARADHRLARRRPGRGSAPRLERRDRLRRVARAVGGRRRPGRARRDRAQPAGTGRRAAAERPAAGTHRVRVGHRRQHDRRPLLREPAGPVGHA